MLARSAKLPLTSAVGLAIGVLSLGLLPVSVSPALAGPWTLAPGEKSADLSGGWFSADSYHDQNGDKLRFAGNGLLEQRSITWSGELGFKKRVSVVYSLPFVSVTRRIEPAPQPFLPTATGFGDAVLGFKWRLKNGRSAAALEVDWKAPLGYERAPTHFADDSTDINVVRQREAPRLGDGQQDVSAVLHLGTALASRGFAQVAAGYNHRFEDPADQIVMGADVGAWMGRTWMLAVRYRGEIATSGSNETRDPDLHRVGPVLLYRVDDHLDLFAGMLHTAKAVNATHTDEMFVGLTFKKTKLDRLQGYLGTTQRP